MTPTTPKSSTTYRMWQRLSGRPGGTRLFSAAAMARVPYFASVLPHVEHMEPGFAQVSVPNWFFVHNHLHTVHAIASCNAAEMAMGMLMEATVPSTHRWIPKAMTVNYLGKATTSLRATARLTPPTSRRSPRAPRWWSRSASPTAAVPRWCMPISPPG